MSCFASTSVWPLHNPITLLATIISIYFIFSPIYSVLGKICQYRTVHLTLFTEKLILRIFPIRYTSLVYEFRVVGKVECYV